MTFLWGALGAAAGAMHGSVLLAVGLALVLGACGWAFSQDERSAL